MTLIERCNKFISELGTPVTVFCKKVQISVRTYYAWRNGELKLSDPTTARIDNYISKYGF